MAGLTYAKAGGPPNNFTNLEVIDNATGKRVPRVIEVNTLEGWVRLYRTSEDGALVIEDGASVVDRVEGRFRIVERRG